MARSKSWTESQQPDNQYTYTQYIFNVIVVGLLVLGLVAFLVWVLRPTPSPTTHLVTVRSNVGELRAIPFQANDFDQLKNAFNLNDSSLLECDPFNDRQSFEDVVQANVNNLECDEIDTLIVVCSAVGDIGVQNALPILRATDGSGEISIEKFLKECVASKVAKNRIVILDCGHDFSKPSSYFADPFNPGDDYNRFVDGISQLMKGLDVGGSPIWVITSTGSGEIPLYSVNQRRTLFSLALETALAEKHDDVGKFYNSLVEFCHANGGEAAQTPQLFQSGRGPVTAGEIASEALAKFAVKKKVPVPAEGEDAPPFQDPETTNQLDDFSQRWNNRERILAEYETKNLLSPMEFATARWEQAELEIAERSVAFRNSLESKSGDRSIQDFEESELSDQGMIVTKGYPGVVAVKQPPLELDSQELERRDIARAFATYQATMLRAKYYAAIFDSLSWLHESQTMESFKNKLIDLNRSLIGHAALFDDASAEMENTEQYRIASKELVDLEADVKRRLNNLCRRLSELHSMTREMAILSVLESPLVRNGSPEEPTDSDRVTLLKLLRTENGGTGERFESEQRKSNSSDRREMYQQLIAFCQSNAELKNRSLDAVAYYLEVGKSHLPTPLSFVPRTTVFTAVAEASGSLRKGKIIDLTSGDKSQPGVEFIDVQLKTDPPGGLVDLECTLDPDAPFVIYDPKDPPNTGGQKIVIKDSDGKIGIYAKTDAESFEGAVKNFSLTVLIRQTYNGKTFSNPQQPFKIPLTLPSQNQVELFVKLGEQVQQKISPEDSFSIRPWPNLATTISMSVSNSWHKGRQLRATIYPCLEIDKSISGTINEAVKQRTRLALRNGVLPAISQSATIKIDPSVDGVPPQPKRIDWPATPPPPDPNQPVAKLAKPGEPFPQGLLCRVEDIESGKAWDFWLPVFPETRDYLTVRPRVDGNSFWLDVTKIEDEFKDRPVKLSWRLSDSNQGNGSATLDSPDKKNVPAIKDLKAAVSEGSRPFFYVDVDGWPRRFTFVYDGLNFVDPNTDKKNRFPNATFTNLRLTEKQPEQDPFQRFESDDANIANFYGHRPTDGAQKTLFGKLEINCVINANQFSFPDSKDFFEIKYGNDAVRYYFPRKIMSTFAPDPETGVWKMRCDVADYEERRELAGNRFEINPVQFEFGGQRQALNGSDITRIIFDSDPPPPPELTIHTNIAEPDGAVGFQVSNIRDNRGGIGVKEGNDYRDAIEYILNDKPAQHPRKLKGVNQLGFRAPKEEGLYRLGVRIIDQLGNKSDLVTGEFEVRKKQPKPVAKPKDPVAKPPPPPVTHVLLVRVKVASSALKAGQEPELEIEPPDAAGKRISGDTFEFEGLKSGVEYTVTGKYKMETGFKVETAGKTSYEFAKDAKTKITKTKILKLEGQ